MPRSLALVPLCVALGLASCGDSARSGDAAAQGRVARDSRADGLFADFIDGKFDGNGHPLNATVFEAETACEHDTGAAEAEGWAAWPDRHPSGAICKAKATLVEKGVFTFNVRALTQASSGAAPAALTITVRDASGDVIESKVFTSEAWPSMTWQNLGVRFSHATPEAVSFEVGWSASGPVRIDYAELFRTERQLTLSPPSGVMQIGTSLLFEFNDPPTGTKFEADCDGVDQTAVLDDLLAKGIATIETTDFRMTVTVPAESLLGACNLPSRFKVKAVAGGYARATSRVSYRASPPPCTFEDGKTRVLLTGFEPFPADSTSDNSAERAVKGFDPSGLDVTVMKLIIPVEYDAAPGWVAEVIDRCKPDVVVGFGQGRSAVDIETTAYNIKDTAEVSGGVPDNRGIIYGGEPIVAGGPAELKTGLPVEAILQSLQDAGIDAGPSDDPGRYVCNNLFYTIMTKVQGTGRMGGFVHLPHMYTVDAAAQAMLQQVVTAVVQQSAARVVR
jgi:pyroglutamyl-peptidase